MADTPVVLLAAGGSTRMGEPKQLLPWGNVKLIEHQIQTLLKTKNPVFVVLGSGVRSIIPVIEDYDVGIIVNEQWEKGMGSSIAKGVEGVHKAYPHADGVLITLLDQPLITVSHLKRILKAFQPGRGQIIVSQSVTGWKGVPVLFDKAYFSELRKLKEKEGAKKIIRKHQNFVVAVECGNILEDMDTPGVYHRLRSNQSAK